MADAEHGERRGGREREALDRAPETVSRDGLPRSILRASVPAPHGFAHPMPSAVATTHASLLSVAQVLAPTHAEGPHRRAAMWVQGCSLRCPGCCNPELFSTRGGHARDEAWVTAWLARARDQHGVEGLTILGGEPLDQIAATTWTARAARSLGLGVLIFTGYERDEVAQMPDHAALLEVTDTLVVGRFDRARPRTTTTPRVLGSSNQSLWHVTRRYADPQLWRSAPVAELHLDGDGAVVCGDPALVSLIRRALGPTSRPQRDSGVDKPPTSRHAGRAP